MFKLVGYLFLALAAVVLASDVYNGLEDEFRLTALGEWWFWAHKDSLQVLQPAIERHVSVWLFESVIQPLLEWPLAVELGVLGGTIRLLAGLR